MKYKCPEHGDELEHTKTHPRPRGPDAKCYTCPVPGCTVGCWDGHTSTPADQKTREARALAHSYFDKLWRDQFERSYMYGKLAKEMKLTNNECHIGKMDFEQCAYVIEFAIKEINEANKETR